MQTPMGDLNDSQTKRNVSAASLAELREFMARLKGRRPQDVIGIVSASLLVQSMIQAAVAVLGIMVVFTLGPYLIYGSPQPKAVAPKSAMTNGATAVGGTESNAMPSKVGVETDTNSLTPVNDVPPNIEKATKVLGLDETKAADPKTNPLDSPNLDKLLDGLDR